MSNASSPTRFSSEHIYDPNFTHEMNSKMRVPKRIKVDGTNEDDLAANFPQWMGPSGGVNEKVDMQIPERIVLIGQEKTFGTTAPAREITLENQVLPPDPAYIRVQTPPRVITLDHNYRDDYDRKRELESDDEFLEVNHQASTMVTPYTRPAPPASSDVANLSLFDTPAPVNGTVRDELAHLRSQMGKQNKRLVRLEYEIEERRKRDKVLFSITAAYLILKTLIWWAKD